MKTGDIVWANFGDGEKLAFYISADGGKAVIQDPSNGKDDLLAYREPEDRDAHGSGKTWWKA